MTRAGSVVLHGHFYQPPREDPWFGLVPRQPSAAPFHDWNVRIERECYGPVTSARLTDAEGRIERIVNTLSFLSFDFGPTLLRWMEREAPGTYRAVLEADRISQERAGGYGNAMAMPYHHAILPLSSRRDKVTEVRWGIEDFRRRFGRDPHGMWLPETAVDLDTLDVLAGEHIAFTVLAPHQVDAAPATGRPGRIRTPCGREIAVFVYDGPRSHAVAFGDALRDAKRWADELARAVDSGAEVVSVATDGESYGHHYTFGEMALAAAVTDLTRRPGVRLENFASVLARCPPTEDVQLVEPSSWSCVHGVERWRADCGCRMDPGADTQQSWRGPLRAAVKWLVAALHEEYETRVGRWTDAPWELRDRFGSVVEASPTRRSRFAEELGLDETDTVRLLTLLEMERQALATQTSCGWFFDDLAGIETVQVLRHAARAIELAGEDAERLTRGFRERLAAARSNIPEEGTGTEIYDRRARPPAPASARAAAGILFARSIGSSVALTAQGDLTARDVGERVEVTDGRTGRVRSYRGDVRPPGVLDPVVRVEDDVGDAWSFAVDELPETARSAVGRSVLQRFVDRWLTPEERCGVGEPGGGLPGSGIPGGWARGLGRAVSELAGLPQADRQRRVTELLLLLEALGADPPRPAQDALWALLQDADELLARDVAPLAQRLGFADPEVAR